jgi:Na+-transporting methylmalonyl-CoA/oxaloacetate decarboxylase gamma subunit
MRSLVIQIVGFVLQLILLAVAVRLAGELVESLFEARRRRNSRLPSVEFLFPRSLELP